jgi:hypothetical protein
MLSCLAHSAQESLLRGSFAAFLRPQAVTLFGGAFLGILAAVLNTVILTLISIAAFSYVGGSFETSIVEWILQRIFPTILFIGIPPTIFGAAVGACAAKYFRKALLGKSEPSTTMVSTTSR